MNEQHTMERIAPLPPGKSIREILKEYYTTGAVQVLETDTDGWLTAPAIPHAAEVYLLLEYRRGAWAGKRSVLIVEYQLLDIGAGRRELRFSACPEQQASLQTAHACSITLLERVSPTRSPNAQVWRGACWRNLQDHAARSTPQRWDLSLPLALANSEHASILCMHDGYLYNIAWQGLLPRYGEAMHGIVHIQRVEHMQGIAAPEIVVPVAALDKAIDVLLERSVPLSSGWILL